ncbi:hypothetical protein [uncultured Roseibium sp.]|uniref:hypothetical protein n=1 Tax=uncultured Roseibium sp. TaxID=1936171 RepID=UPI0026098FDB|nr:hypothetical protein [uncultured Roseibium sp.]
MARRGGHKKRRQNVNREPNGRLSRRKEYQRNLRNQEREETEREAMETAMAARLRAGIPQNLAQSVGTIEAALFASNALSRDQYEAAVFYNTVRIKYLSAIDEPHAPREPRGPSQGGDEEAFERFCAGAIQQWEGMRNQVMDSQSLLGNTANLFGALDSLERGQILEHQLGDLRCALNAVHKFRINSTKRAA